MKTLLSLLAVAILGVGVSYATMYAPNATSIEELIAQADLVGKGKLGRAGGLEFYGYNEDGSDATLEQRVEEGIIPIEILRQMGMVAVEYEVILSDAWKLNTDRQIILRVMVPALIAHLDETLDRERLFFLSRNHLGNETYGTRGFDAIMEKGASGNYTVATPTGEMGAETIRLDRPAYLGESDSKAEVLESLIAERLSAQR